MALTMMKQNPVEKAEQNRMFWVKRRGKKGGVQFVPTSLGLDGTLCSLSSSIDQQR